MAPPVHPFDACIQRSGIVDKYQTVIFETNRYIVRHISAFAKVKAYARCVAIVHKGRVVAEHRRGYGRRESFLNPIHFVMALSRKPTWLDHVPAIRGWEPPASFERLRSRLDGNVPVAVLTGLESDRNDLFASKCRGNSLYPTLRTFNLAMKFSRPYMGYRTALQNVHMLIDTSVNVRILFL